MAGAGVRERAFGQLREAADIAYRQSMSCSVLFSPRFGGRDVRPPILTRPGDEDARAIGFTLAKCVAEAWHVAFDLKTANKRAAQGIVGQELLKGQARAPADQAVGLEMGEPGA